MIFNVKEYSGKSIAELTQENDNHIERCMSDMEKSSNFNSHNQYEYWSKKDRSDLPFIDKLVEEMTPKEREVLCSFLAARDEGKCRLGIIDIETYNYQDFTTFSEILNNEKLNKADKLKAINTFFYNRYLSMSDEQLQEKMDQNTTMTPERHKKKIVATEGKFVFTINKELLGTHFEELKRLAKESLKAGKDVVVVIDKNMHKTSNNSDVDYIYSPEMMQKIISLNNELVGLGMKDPIKMNEVHELTNSYMLKNCWSLPQVIKANQEINKVASYIKEKGLSPYEAMLVIHTYATSFRYHDSRYPGTFSPRVLLGVFNGGDIVCSGYSGLVKAIVDRLGMEGLKCEMIASTLYNKKESGIKGGQHCQNLVHIKDEKYNINGSYIEDATWDAQDEEKPHGKGFAHCLYPVSDVEHIRDERYSQKFLNNRFNTVVAADPKPYLVEKIEEVVDKLVKPQVVMMYGRKSQPIPRKTFKNALKNVLTIDEELIYGDDTIDQKVQRVEKNSIEFAKEKFDKGAQSCFVNDTPVQTKDC